MKGTIDHQESSQPKNLIKIRRSSIRSSLTRTSLGQSHDGPYQYFPNDNLIPNQTNDSMKNMVTSNEEGNLLDRRASMEKAKVARILRNSISIPKEDKPAISFVPRKSHARIERLHGDDLTPLNNDQYSNISPARKDQQTQISNRR